MSINDILKTIKSEAEKEASEIKKQGEEEVKKIEAQLQKQSKKEQEKILALFRGEMEKKVKQAKFLRESKTRTMMLEKKQEVLDKVYDKVIKKVVDDDNIYKNVMSKVVERLPKVTDAEIVLAKEKGAETKKVLGSKYKISKDTVDTKGGFVLRSKSLEIDNTVEALVREARGETEIEVSKILFNE